MNKEKKDIDCEAILKNMQKICGTNPICKLNKIGEYESCILRRKFESGKEPILYRRKRTEETENEIIENMSYS